MTTRPVPHARDMLPDQKRTGRRSTQICSLRDFSRCRCCCRLSWMPLDMLPSGRNLIFFGTAADSPRLPHARFLPLLIFQQQNARGYYAAWLRPTKQLSRQGAHGWRPCGLSKNVETCFPSFPITPIPAFSSTCCS